MAYNPPASSADVRVGMIGAGAIAQAHMETFRAMQGARVTAVADPIRERAESMASSCGARAFTDFERMFPEVDAVFVNTPPRMHRDHVVTSLSAGKHVFCEKPLAVDIADAEQIVAAQRPSGPILMVGFVLRFQKAYRYMKDFADSSQLGEITNYTCHRLGMRVAKPNHWATEPGQLCGMTIQSFSHDGDLACWLLGTEPDAISASIREREGLDGFDEDMLAVVRMKNGVVANFVLSWSAPIGYGERTISGTHGSVTALGPNMFNVDRVTWRERAANWQGRLVFEPDAVRDRGYVEQNRHFVDCIRKGARPIATGEDGLRALKISRCVLAAAAKNRTLSLGAYAREWS